MHNNRSRQDTSRRMKFALLSLMLCLGYATAETPPCSLCDYYNGIGYIADTTKCGVYYMCIRSPYDREKFKSFTMCCEAGLTFDNYLLSCEWDLLEDCVQPEEDFCPTVSQTTLPFVCEYETDPADPRYYIVLYTNEKQPCPAGQVFDEEYCTCVYGSDQPHPITCSKLLHFNFDLLYDFNSQSCNNFAHGEPYGDAYGHEEVLCLKGVQAFLSIGFLNNWFVDVNEFTLCLWFAREEEEVVDGVEVGPVSNGLLATNCQHNSHVPSVILYIEASGELVAVLGDYAPVGTGQFPALEQWALVCVTYNRGNYVLYYNGVAQNLALSPNPNPPADANFGSQSATTIGYVEGTDGTFDGYIDDFCFWSEALDAGTIQEVLGFGPSNAHFADTLPEAPAPAPQGASSDNDGTPPPPPPPAEDGN